MKERLLQFIEYLGLSVRAFELGCGLQRGNISNMSNNGAIGSDKMSKIYDTHPDLNLVWLLTGKGSMLEVKSGVASDTHQNEITKGTTPIVPLKEYAQVNTPYSIAAESNQNYISDNIISIPIVDVAAAAGHGYFNHDSPETLGELSFPANFLQKRHGNYYCGRVDGESMVPTLLYGDFIVFRLLSPGEWGSIKDGDIYFVVNRSGEAFVKRVKNQLKKDGIIVCKSDNQDIKRYDITIHEEDISNIYHVEWRFSKDMTNINQMYFNRMEAVERRLDDMQEILKSIRK